jgi:hypothetical protein
VSVTALDLCWIVKCFEYLPCYPTETFYGFLQSIQANDGLLLSNRPRPHPPNFLPPRCVSISFRGMPIVSAVETRWLSINQAEC